MKRIQPELVPLLLAAFLAPVIGGQVSIEAMPLSEGFMSGLLGGPELPFGARAFLGTLVALSLAISLVRRRVVQIPNLQVAGLTVALVVLVGLSVLSSEYGYLGYSSWLNWVVYGLCLFTAVAVVGRRVGVRAMAWAMVLGGTLLAYKGITQYADIRSVEPGFRIMADWSNPNALAGILGILIPVSLGLLVSAERIEALGAALCGGLMVFALVLTQSKGGLLTTGIAIAVMVAASLAWKGKAKVVRVIAPLALGALLVFGTMATAKGQGGGVLSRVANSGSSDDQSKGFRTLLWKGAVELIKAKPTGYGAGTYRFESARPGLTEQTYHAHQTWLQLAVEASPLALVVLAALAGCWTWALLYGAKKWPWPDAGLRAGILAACVAAAADGMLESNLIFTGIGMTLFLVLGIGLQASTDGTLPEFTPKKLRWLILVLACVLPTVMLWHTSMVETDKAAARTAMALRDAAGAQSAISDARALAPGDGEALYIQSGLQNGGERLETLRRAVTVMPTTKYLRAYAAAALEQGRQREALLALDNALKRDPNNLATLESKYRTLASGGDLTGAVSAAERLVAVEDSVYFSIRSIPELVPLETYDARVFLAEHTDDKAKKTRLLRGAVEGYQKYFARTPLYIKQHTDRDNPSFLGHDMAEVAAIADRAKAAASTLAKLYGDSGDKASVDWLAGVVSGFSAE